MAVSTTNGFDGPYLANGATTSFPFTFTAPSAAEVAVLLRAADGTETVATGYTVTLSSGSGGSVVFAAAPASGVKVIPCLDPEFTQQVEFEDGSPWLAAPVNEGYDRSAARDQVLKRDVGRALLSPIDEAGTALPPVASRVGKFLAFDAAGNAVATEASGSDGALRSDLADSTGAALVGVTGGGSVQSALDAKVGTTITQSGTGAVARSTVSKINDWVHASDFGVVGNGVATDTTALQAAMNAAASSKRRLILPRDLRTGALTVPTGLRMEPNGSNCTVTTIAGNYNTFTFSASDAQIAGLTMQDALKTGGADFHFACGSGTIRDVFIEDIFSYDAPTLVTDSGSGAGNFINVALRRFRCARIKARGVNLTRMFAFVELDDLTVDYVGVATNDYGFAFDGSALVGADAGGLTLNNLNVLGSATEFTTGVTSQRGYNIANLKALDATKCKGDGLGGITWVIFNVSGGVLTDCASLQGVGGLYIEDSEELTFNNWRTQGRNLAALVYKPANADGILLAGGNDGIQFNGGTTRDNTGHGIHKSVAQVGGILVNGMRSVLNVGRGVYTRGNSAFLFAAGGIGGNTAGNYDLGGNTDRISATQINSGGISGDVVGPVTG